MKNMKPFHKYLWPTKYNININIIYMKIYSILLEIKFRSEQFHLTNFAKFIKIKFLLSNSVLVNSLDKPRKGIE